MFARQTSFPTIHRFSIVALRPLTNFTMHAYDNHRLTKTQTLFMAVLLLDAHASMSTVERSSLSQRNMILSSCALGLSTIPSDPWRIRM